MPTSIRSPAILPARTTRIAGRPARALRIATQLTSIAFLLMGATAAAQQTRTWTGALDGLWSKPGNWSPAGAPVDGDSLVFPPGALVFETVNDLPAGRHFPAISLTGNQYRLAGNGIVVSERIASTGFDVDILLPVDLQAHDVGLHGTENSALLELAAPVSGSGNIEIGLAGQPSPHAYVAFSGSHPYSGTLLVRGDCSDGCR